MLNKRLQSNIYKSPPNILYMSKYEKGKQGTYSSSPVLLVFLVGTMVNTCLICSTASEEENSKKIVSYLNTNLNKTYLRC